MLTHLLEVQQSILDQLASNEPHIETLDLICQSLEQQIPGSTAAILIADDETGQLFVGAAPNLDPARRDAIDGCTAELLATQGTSHSSVSVVSDHGHILGALVVFGDGQTTAPERVSWLLHRYELVTKATLTRFAQQRSVLALVAHERERIAGEIHDDSIQAVTAVSLRLQRLQARVTDDEQLQLVADARGTTDEAIDRLRRMLFRLSPPGLDEDGLVITFELFLEGYLEPFGMEWEVRGDDTSRAPAPIEALAFRLGREAITNAVKHAAATRIVVDVEYGSDALEVTVTDNGVGFDPRVRHHIAEAHLGLRHSRVLAASAGGVFEVNSTPSEGTAVRVSLPNLTES